MVDCASTVVRSRARDASNILNSRTSGLGVTGGHVSVPSLTLQYDSFFQYLLSHWRSVQCGVFHRKAHSSMDGGKPDSIIVVDLSVYMLSNR